MKVVSYYSPEYLPYSYQLRESCHQFQVEWDVEAVPSFANWQDGVAYKPQFILEKLQSIPDGSGLLWVDADAKFVREPDFSIFNAVDLAVCQFQWSKNHPIEFLTGTLMLRSTPRVKDFVKRWMLATPTWRKANLDTPEQLSLKETYELQKDHPNALRYLNLPVEWVWIEPEFNELYKGKCKIISHYQASRRVRK